MCYLWYFAFFLRTCHDSIRFFFTKYNIEAHVQRENKPPDLDINKIIIYRCLLADARYLLIYCWGLDLWVKPSPSEMLSNSFAGPQREKAKHTRRYRMNTQKRKLKDHDLRRRRISPSLGRRWRMAAQRRKRKDQYLRRRRISPSSGRRWRTVAQMHKFEDQDLRVKGLPSGTMVTTDRSLTEPSGPWPPELPEGNEDLRLVQACV